MSRPGEVSEEERRLEGDLAQARKQGVIDASEYHALSWLLVSLSDEAHELTAVETDALALPDNPGAPNPVQARLDALLRRVNGIIAGASGMLSGLSKAAAGSVSRIWQFFSNTLMQILQNIAGKLHIQNWSIGITGGIPAGLSGTFTVTFGP